MQMNTSPYKLATLFGIAQLASGFTLPEESNYLVARRLNDLPKMPPIQYDIPRTMSKRDMADGFRLRDQESFYYGDGEDHDWPLANVTGTFKNSNERIINMERFAGMLDGIDCTAPEMKLDFKDADGFRYAKESWSWVRERAENKFIMMANAPGCGPDNDRQPYQVTDIRYDEEKYAVHLTAHEVEFEQSLPQFSVHADTRGIVDNAEHLAKRWSVGKTFTKSLERDYSGTNLIDQGFNGVNIRLDCEKCGSFGGLDIAVRVAGHLTWFKPKMDEASITITPSNLELTALLGLEVQGTLSDPYEKIQQSPTFPLSPISVPFTKIGPQFALEAGAALGEWHGRAKTTYGASLEIPGDSQWKINFLNKNEITKSGWEPEFKRIPPTFEAEVTGSARLWFGAAITVDASLAGYGADAALRLEGPELTSEFLGKYDTENPVCGNAKAGIDLDVSVGAQFYATASAGLGKYASFTYSQPFFSQYVPAYSTCLGIGTFDGAMESSAIEKLDPEEENTLDAAALASAVVHAVHATPAANAYMEQITPAANAINPNIDSGDGFTQVTDAPDPTMQPFDPPNPVDKYVGKFPTLKNNGTNSTDGNQARRLLYRAPVRF